MASRNIAKLTAQLVVPALHIVKLPTPSLSHFGGNPSLPENLAWPECNGRKLDFLARISLAEIQKTSPVNWLPQKGALLFFYDMEEQPWGFDPKDRSGFAVLLVPDVMEPVRQKTSDQKNGNSTIPFASIHFRSIKVLPSADSAPLSALNLNDDEFDLFSELLDKPFSNEPKHQIAGFPSPFQSDTMEEECQLASNGLYCGDSRGYNDPRALNLKAGARDWRLLFQFDSDDNLEIMWGDSGKIYFWVKENEAKQGNFSNVWVILQCC